MKNLKNIFKAGTLTVLVGAVITLSMNGCNKPDSSTSPAPGNEFLTTTMLVVTDSSNPSFHDTAVWSDTHPNDTLPPDTSRARLTLMAGHTYEVYILILDSTQTPTANISDEIYDRRNYHIFCFNTSAGLNLSVTRADYDSNKSPLPFGLHDYFYTGPASTGTLEVTLKHQPNVKDGTCTPGSTDLDVTYRITLQ